MRIESISLSNFRCFGPDTITVPISPEITAVVGPNAAGKTALLHALSKMFGVSRAQRTVQRSDFHLGAGDEPDDREDKNLFIDVLISFPELADGTATPETIAPSFRHMQIEREGKSPVCRLRLEARWEDDGTVEGEVSQEIFWVDTLDDEPAEDECHPVSASDRGLIQLYYTPASRDAATQIRTTTGALAARLLRAIEGPPRQKRLFKRLPKTWQPLSRKNRQSPQSAKPCKCGGQDFTMRCLIRNPGSASSVVDSRRSSTRLPSSSSRDRMGKSGVSKL